MTSETQLADFISRHKLLLRKERDAEIERSSLLLSNCGPKLLEQKGLALLGLGVVGINIGLGGKTLIELERPSAYHSNVIFPPHTFRPGDLARIEENSNAKKTPDKKSACIDGKNSNAVEGVVYKVSNIRIVIAVDEASSDDLDLPERCHVLKLANSVTYDRMEKALNQLEKTVLPSSENEKAPQEMNQLIRVLLGIVKPSERLTIQNLNFFDESLNHSQKEAVKFALESPEVACIHGPPGTGKTRTLIEIIRQLASAENSDSRPNRLLVCGASNLSVDNILERLLALPVDGKEEKLKVTRIGHPARVMASQGILDATLDFKAGRSEEAALARDVKNELEATLGVLSGKGKGAKGKKPRGAEKKRMWDEVKALRKEYRLREGKVVTSVLKDSQIILATCHSSGGKQLRDLKFDVVLIDEATQALEAVCWVPIFKAKKLILAGDPMQLPPTILSVDKPAKVKTISKQTSNTNNSSPVVQGTKQGKTQESVAEVPGSVDPDLVTDSSSSEESADEAVLSPPQQESETKKISKKSAGLKPPRSLETTLFDRLERMYGSGIKRMLQVQYRMHAQICAFPSKTLYSSELFSHSSVESRLLRDLPGTNAEEEEENEILGTPIVFFDTAGCEYFERLDGDGDEGSRCNENEASVVKIWVEQLIEAGVSPGQIAIITPYQAQVTLLTSLLRPLYGLDLEIGTVDGMQGREKDVVVISLVRSNETREVGFLKEKRRLNVAMTRAKRHLCIVGDSSTVQHGGKFLKKWLTWLEANADIRFAGLE